MRLPLILVATVVLLAPAPALAYLDPGSGSMILQMLVAGLAAAAFTLKLYWQRVKKFFAKSPRVPVGDSPPGRSNLEGGPS